MRVSPFRLPCFAIGLLICLKPVLISNSVQETRKTSKATVLTTTRSAQAHIQLDKTQEEDG